MDRKSCTQGKRGASAASAAGGTPYKLSKIDVAMTDGPGFSSPAKIKLKNGKEIKGRVARSDDKTVQIIRQEGYPENIKYTDIAAIEWRFFPKTIKSVRNGKMQEVNPEGSYVSFSEKQGLFKKEWTKKKGKYLDETDDKVTLEVDGEIKTIKKTALRDIKLEHEPFKEGFEHLIYRSDGTVQWAEIVRVDTGNQIVFKVGTNAEGKALYKAFQLEDVVEFEKTYMQAFSKSYSTRTQGWCNPGTPIPDHTFVPFRHRKYAFEHEIARAAKEGEEALFNMDIVDARARNSFIHRKKVDKDKARLAEQEASVRSAEHDLELKKNRVEEAKRDLSLSAQRHLNNDWHIEQIRENPTYRRLYESYYEEFKPKAENAVLGEEIGGRWVNSFAHEKAIKAAAGELDLDLPKLLSE